MDIKSKADLLKLDKGALTTLALNEYDVAIDPEDMEKKEIVGYILALQDGRQEVETSDREAEIPPSSDLIPDITASPKSNEDRNVGADKKVKIIIHKSDGIDGGASVKVGVNGYVRVIKREAEVIVPRYVYQVLLDAKQTLYESVPKDGGIEQVATEVQRFPVSFLGNVS